MKRSFNKFFQVLPQIDTGRPLRPLLFLALGLGLTLPPALVLAFNYQRQNSPLLTSTLLALRTSSELQKSLGSDLDFEHGRLTLIRGPINYLKGRVDIRFPVKDARSKRTGEVHLVCLRDRDGSWRTKKFQVLLSSLEEEEKGEKVVVELMNHHGSLDWQNHVFATTSPSTTLP